LTPRAAKSSFWTRADDDGAPKKLQPQRIPVILAAAAFLFPVVLFSGRVGTRAVRSVACSVDRHLWTHVAEVDRELVSPRELASRLEVTPPETGTPIYYDLDYRGIADTGNTAAVRRDALALRDGATVRWNSTAPL